MSFLSEKIDLKINHLKSEYESNKNISHQGVKGGFNENALSSLVKEVIPTKYKITKGVIENSEGEQSNETDIIIYDDEILPLYIQNDLSFVPVEAVKYVFEVKSQLTSNELQTTIQKFLNFKKLGGISPTVLFAYSSDIKSNELNRYYKNENDFFINPSITALCISGKCYYYKSVTEHYIKDYCNNEKLIQRFLESSGLDIDEKIEMFRTRISNNAALEKMSRIDFSDAIVKFIEWNNHKQNLSKKELIINEIKFNEIKFKIHKWIGIEQEQGVLNNDIELSLLSGISNTLSKGNFGQYLLNNKKLSWKTYAICYEDMWGNLSCQDFNENGIDYNVDESNFSYQSNPENNTNKIIFKINKLPM